MKSEARNSYLITSYILTHKSRYFVDQACMVARHNLLHAGSITLQRLISIGSEDLIALCKTSCIDNLIIKTVHVIWGIKVITKIALVWVIPPSSLRTAYRPILALRTAYTAMFRPRVLRQFNNNNNNHFWRFHLHKK